MKNIIFGLYNGYTSLKTDNGGIYYFMKSLRKYNKNCKVVVVCEKNKIFRNLILCSLRYNFEIYSDFEVKYDMIFQRFEIYKKYLDEKKSQKNKQYNKVLLSDMNDVIFQDDPFSIDFTEEIYCALETNIIIDREKRTKEDVNINWINESRHLFKDYHIFQNRRVACAGTILGTYHGIQKYLDFFVKVQKNKIVNDQGLFNVYVYNYLQSKKMKKYEKSKILTLDRIPFESLHLDNNNYVVNEKSEKYCIVHQINRCNVQFFLQMVNSV
jgi:hypothetical protein